VKHPCLIKSLKGFNFEKMKKRHSNPELDIVLVVRSLHRPGSLGALMTIIGEEEGLIGNIVTISIGKTHSVREITVSVYDKEHLDHLAAAIRNHTHIKLLEIKDIVFEKHLGGKIHSRRNEDVTGITDLRYIYTPGVARVCTAIHEDISKAKLYTNISKSVGIFTNGTRILGLGDIGPVAGMPVMEGKAVLYDQFAGISATPILIDTKDSDEFIRTVINVSKTFGGIHLEDIRTPDCFYIEDELIKRLDKPVMHDDQHGTATVTLAAIITAMRLTGKKHDKTLVVGQIGLGAAGLGIARLLIDFGLKVIGTDLNPVSQKRLLDYGGQTASLDEVMKQAEIIVATTGVPGLIKPEMVRKGQIILALSNPEPEISPEDALEAGAAFADDGKSINNALAFPGLFKAALEGGADSITSKMKIAAAIAISSLAADDDLVPDIFNKHVHKNIVEAVKKVI
jgi:malate dehydrogenase (oxaloacetate-decarboxylating)